MNSLPAVQSLEIDSVYAALGTRPNGLDPTEVVSRLQQYGPNTILEIRPKPIIFRFLANFTHLMAILLWVGGFVGFIAQMPQLGVAIWMVNIINGAFSFWQEYKAEKATEALRKLLPHYALVLRQGQEQRILAEELVPGDVLLLAEGDHISADARLVLADELQIDQSTLTGEARSVRKTSDPVLQNSLARLEFPNMVFAGTNVSAGAGRAVVCSTAMNTEFGTIASLTQSVQDEISPLQKEIAVATRVITLISVAVGIVFFVLALILAGMNAAESFIFGMGMIVAFVPEGMLPTITLSLAMGVQRMARRNALVKRLSGVETLGCTTVICTDKTGTLTQNEMTVRELWLLGRRLTVTGVGYAPDGQLVDGQKQVHTYTSSDVSRLLRAAVLCNDSRLVPPNSGNNQWAILGDPTEAALRVVALKGGLDPDTVDHQSPRLRELPFDSRRKRMSTIHPNTVKGQGQQIAYVKGAPREVLALCKHGWSNDHAEPLTDSLRAKIAAVNDDYARDGLRVLAVAERPLPDHLPKLSEYTSDLVEHDLTFLGLMAMMDPPRPEVSEAIDRCHRAGIRVIMITGDYGLTAESIARRIGIIQSKQPRVITGLDLEVIHDDELKEALKDEVIFARVTPENKLRVVRLLQELGHVVAVTGDGVNDAPALKKADIGVAMGIAGTDVAKEAADIILTDDNFASIVNAVEEGRAVYANIKKFITYIFTSNAPEAVPFIVFAFSQARIPLALNIMQILAIDLGTDMVPALGLGTEPPEPGIMHKPPRDLHEHIITPEILVRAYLWLGMLQGLAAMVAFYFVYWTNGYFGQWIDLPAEGNLYRMATAMTLAMVVAMQIGNVFAQRTERISVFRIGLFSNRLIWIGIMVEVIQVMLIVYVPFLQYIFGTAAFPPTYWLFLLAFTPTLLLADELRKGLVRWYSHRR